MRLVLLAGVAGCALALGAGRAGATAFSYDGAVQTYTVATTGLYDITAFGAQGGSGPSSNSGGLGAEVSGVVRLTQGTVLDVVVGGQGSGSSVLGSGGGGGSFVFVPGATLPLAVAGGGGGPGLLKSGSPGLSGTAGGGGGGTNGSGGQAGAGVSGFAGGAGGGGWLSGGQAGSGVDSSTGGSGPPGFAGGTGFYGGGFGAAGGAGGASGGGGGGYSGGGGGSSGGGGGGGGSYLTTLASDPVLTAGVNSGNGAVTITAAAVPEPATLALLGGGLFALALSRRRRT